jgi:hypothetical protein
MSEFRRRQMMAASVNEDRYLTFTAVEANSTVSMQAVETAPSVSLEYSVDNGSTWIPFVVNSTVVTLANVGDNVKLRGQNTAFATNTQNYNNFIMTGKIAASGDTTSILNGIGGDVALNDYAFSYLYRDCTSLVAASELPSTNLSNRCYFGLYRNTSITDGILLPARTSAVGAYQNMFYSCDNLVNPPIILLENISTYTCYSMFEGCVNLETAPELFFQTSTGQCCYRIFLNCRKLNYIKTHLTRIVASTDIGNWVNNVSQNGTFVCDQSLSIPSGNSGIPTGWTRLNLDGTPYVEP